MHQPPAEAGTAATTMVAETTGALETAYAKAAAAGDESETQITLAGSGIRIKASSHALLQKLGEAFGHLTGGPRDGAPDLTVHLWDSSAEPGATPPLPQTEPDEPRGAVFYSASGPLQIAYQPGLAQLSVLDSDRGLAWFWCRDGDQLPFWEPAAPFRQILHWWLAERGLMLLHGAAVGTAEGGVLLVGRGGSGKSTCALASLDSDLLYAGDDYVAVQLTPSPWVYSVYASGKLTPNHSRLLPHLPPPSFPGDGSPEEKAVFFVNERFPRRMCAGFPLRAVIVPRVTPGEPHVSPVDPATALRALAPSTLLQLHPALPTALTNMARLLREVPTYTLETGEQIGAIPSALKRLLEELPA